MIRRLADSIGKLVLFLGKIWERNELSPLLFRPASAKKFTKFFSRYTLILGEIVRVALGHTIAAVPKALFANLLRDNPTNLSRCHSYGEKNTAPKRRRALFASCGLLDGSVDANNFGKDFGVNLWDFKLRERLVQ